MITAIPAANPGPMTGSGNWTYLVRGTSTVLIDAGVGAPAHLDDVARQCPDGPTHVVVTHAHVDHASGAPAIAARWPQTRFSKMPWPERDVRYPVDWQPLANGDMVDAGDDTLEVIHTPGHAPDHVALWHQPSRTLLSGDLVVLGTTVVIPATAGGSLAQYLQSLRRVIDLKPQRLLPAHGPAIDNPEAILRRYLDHRHQREVQVLSALEAGSRTVDSIVSRIYAGLADPLIPMARESVLAHLIKLEADGLAARSGDEWHTSE